MRKIPTLFVRDPATHLVTDQVTPGCEWVLAGEGRPTRKLDGSCCLIEQGKLYRRRELRAGQPHPPGFREVEHDPNTGKTFGWVPVGSEPEAAWHREAFSHEEDWQDGTYELVGPKINGNPEHYAAHRLIRHGSVDITIPAVAIEAQRGFEAIKMVCLWGLAEDGQEGIVWHHPDGRMAKIKAKDFGMGVSDGRQA